MKNFIYIITLILCVIVSSANAQTVKVSKSTSIALSQGFHKVANIIEDVDSEDIEVRSIAMMQDRVNPEVELIATTGVLGQGFHKVVNVIEDVDTEDFYIRDIAMMQEEINPEAPETNIARNNEGVSTKY